MMNKGNPILSSLLAEQVLHLAVSKDHSANFVDNIVSGTKQPELATEAGRSKMFETAMAQTYGDRAATGELYNKINNIAVIPIHGSTINRLNSTWGFITGYNYIKAALWQAVNSQDIDAVVFDVNSHGGEVAGCFETAEFIKNATGLKPIYAVIDSNCHSAAYALVSGCTSIIATPSASIGSIGVVAIHASVEKMYKNAGINITFIQAGKNKTLGNPYQDLSDDAKAHIQQRIDNSYKIFTSTVAENRNIDEKDVIKTEASCYNSKEALSIGLIDSIATVEAAIQFVINQSGAKIMTDKEKANAVPANTADVASTAVASTAVASVAANTADVASTAVASVAANTADVASTAVASVVASERQRIKAIVDCEAAVGKANLANHLAFNTNMAVDEAVAILNAASAETAKDNAQQHQNLLDEAMAKTGSPNVGADSADADDINIADVAALANSFKLS